MRHYHVCIVRDRGSASRHLSIILVNDRLHTSGVMLDIVIRFRLMTTGWCHGLGGSPEMAPVGGSLLDVRSGGFAHVSSFVPPVVLLSQRCGLLAHQGFKPHERSLVVHLGTFSLDL